MRALTGVDHIATSTNALSITAEKIADVRPSRHRIVIRNNDGAIVVYVGPTSSVSSTVGFAIGAGVREEFDYSGELWAIAASGTPSIAIAEEY